MNKANLKRAERLASFVRGTFDRKTIGGLFFGVAIMMSTWVSADPAGGSGWFSGLLSTSSAGSSSALISQQDSVVAAAITKEAADCANGAHGSIGEAIKTAMNAHTQMASATPAVESLFDVNSECFSSISQIFDLSFSIPSWGQILSAAQAAVIQYAQKKICTAVNKTTGMVTWPINQAIGNINKMQGFTDINGMANSAVGGAMTTIDPQLGAEYHGTAGTGLYNVNTNPFNKTQTTFDGTAGGAGGSGNLGDKAAQIAALTQQIADLRMKLYKDQEDVKNTEYSAWMCNLWNGQIDCTERNAAAKSARDQLAADQAALVAAQAQLAQIGGGASTGGGEGSGSTGGGFPMPSSPVIGQSAPARAQASKNTSSSNDGWWSGISGLFSSK